MESSKRCVKLFSLIFILKWHNHKGKTVIKGIEPPNLRHAIIYLCPILFVVRKLGHNDISDVQSGTFTNLPSLLFL